MELGIVLGVVAVIALVGAIVFHAGPRLGKGEPEDLAFLLYAQVAEQIGGLVVVRSETGWPRIEGRVDGADVEIDHANDIAPGLERMLALRCQLPEALMAPNGAIWIGEIPALHTQFGRPRPIGDPDGLFELYTRTEASASDWWQEPELFDALLSLPGSGVVLYEGQLTVVFSDLDAESVRTAMQIPSLIRRGVSRVTLH